EQAVAPLRVAVGIVEGHARYRRRSRPHIKWRCHALDLGALRPRNGQPRIVAAIRGDGPAIIVARFRDIDFVAAAWPMLVQPELATPGVECRPLRIAMPVAPDFGAGAVPADKGVVVGHRTVGAQTHQLALKLVEILRRGALVVLAQGNEEVALTVEYQPHTKVLT